MSRAKRKLCAQTGHNPCKCGKRHRKATYPLSKQQVVSVTYPIRSDTSYRQALRLPDEVLTDAVIAQLRKAGYVEYDPRSAGARAGDWR